MTILQIIGMAMLFAAIVFALAKIGDDGEVKPWESKEKRK